MNLTPYDDLAAIYDHFQQDIDSRQWGEYIHQVIQRLGPSKGDGQDGRLLVCDLGCGTGSVAIELCQSGYDVIGIDESPLMLEEAREKAEAAGVNILFLCQDITNLELFGTVDVFVCLLDTVNHLVNKTHFKKMLSLFKNYLNPGGLFIFDVVTPTHLEETLGNHFFYTVAEDYALLWENRFSNSTKVSTSDITLFRESENPGLYERYEGQIKERIYTHKELEGLLKQAGLALLEKSNGFSGHEDSDLVSERDFYITQMKQQTGLEEKK